MSLKNLPFFFVENNIFYSKKNGIPTHLIYDLQNNFKFGYLRMVFVNK